MKAIIAATILGIIMMYAGLMVKDKKSIGTLATILMFILLGVNVWELMTVPANAPQVFFNTMIRIDRYALWFNTLMTGCSLLYLLRRRPSGSILEMLHCFLSYVYHYRLVCIAV